MLKIEDILREDFDWENVEIDENEFDELENQLIINYLKKNSPKERQLLAIDWNFDNSKEVIKWIAEQPDTDKGTALFLYWYMNPQFFKKYENRKECEEEDSWALEDFDIVETLEKNYISGYYKNQKYEQAKEWLSIALSVADLGTTNAGTYLLAGIFYYDLEKYDEAYKHFDIAYNDAGYYPFSIEDKKYWQFYKQRKDELNPKKKTKK